ncbi:MAG: hypothetical protein JNK05_37760 [Myxococcales bacterium]|nr:hypothetical protein [Myxococcales bacterium]
MTIDARPKPQEKYAQRLKARLARPHIAVEEARDGLLDCFVATYHEGLDRGLKGVLGLDATVDDVARVAAGMFRTRMARHGATFESPTIDALSKVKDEVDRELHFEELSADLRGVHDQVCSLLLAKAEGSLEHHGDTSAVAARPSLAEERAAPTPSAPVAATSSSRLTGGVSAGLRSAVAAYLDEFRDAVLTGESSAQLSTRSKKLERLLGSLADFE